MGCCCSSPDAGVERNASLPGQRGSVPTGVVLSQSSSDLSQRVDQSEAGASEIHGLQSGQQSIANANKENDVPVQKRASTPDAKPQPPLLKPEPIKIEAKKPDDILPHAASARKVSLSRSRSEKLPPLPTKKETTSAEKILLQKNDKPVESVVAQLLVVPIPSEAQHEVQNDAPPPPLLQNALPESPIERPVETPTEVNRKISVCVRKRPLNSRELARGDQDIVSVSQGCIVRVREPKSRVDLTEYEDEHEFALDVCLDENATNTQLYRMAVAPLLETVFCGGRASCFAYGQTGSGKTFTMMGSGATAGGNQNSEENLGIYVLAARDIFARLSRPEYSAFSVWMAFFEVYGGKLFDLLNKRGKLLARTDAEGEVNVVGLVHRPVTSEKGLIAVMEDGLSARVVGATGANDASSRSHALLQITVKDGQGVEYGRLTVVDLAGNERGADTVAQDRRVRMEGAEINRSLLALKECIRALAVQQAHTPFRGSMLTSVLKDSFVGPRCSTLMVACMSPASSCVEPTLNTLRYANRVKELKLPPRAPASPSKQPPAPPPPHTTGPTTTTLPPPSRYATPPRAPSPTRPRTESPKPPWNRSPKKQNNTSPPVRNHHQSPTPNRNHSPSPSLRSRPFTASSEIVTQSPAALKQQSPVPFKRNRPMVSHDDNFVQRRPLANDDESSKIVAEDRQRPITAPPNADNNNKNIAAANLLPPRHPAKRDVSPLRAVRRFSEADRTVLTKAHRQYVEEVMSLVTVGVNALMKYDDTGARIEEYIHDLDDYLSRLEKSTLKLRSQLHARNASLSYVAWEDQEDHGDKKKARR